MEILEELDKLRMAALGGDTSAATRAAKVIERLRTKPIPPAEFRAARWLALEARGFALRHATDHLLIRSAMVTELTGATGSRENLASGLLRALDQWKQECDALIDEAIEAGDGNLVPTLLHMRSHHQMQEVLSYVRVAPWDKGFQATMPAQFAEGIARARGARDAFAKLNIHMMRIRATGLEMDWQWISGNRSEAVALAREITTDAHATSDPAAVERARRVLAGSSPLPEFDALPAIDA